MSGSLHFKLIISPLETVGVSATSAIDVGQGVDLAFNIHPFLETLFDDIGFIELLGGLNLVAIEADEDIARRALFTVRASAFVPMVTVTTTFGRETKIGSTFVLG